MEPDPITVPAGAVLYGSPMETPMNLPSRKRVCSENDQRITSIVWPAVSR